MAAAEAPRALQTPHTAVLLGMFIIVSPAAPAADAPDNYDVAYAEWARATAIAASLNGFLADFANAVANGTTTNTLVMNLRPWASVVGAANGQGASSVLAGVSSPGGAIVTAGAPFRNGYVGCNHCLTGTQVVGVVVGVVSGVLLLAAAVFAIHRRRKAGASGSSPSGERKALAPEESPSSV